LYFAYFLLVQKFLIIVLPSRRAKERKITKRKGDGESESHDRENDGSASPISAISGKNCMSS